MQKTGVPAHQGRTSTPEFSKNTADVRGYQQQPPRVFTFLSPMKPGKSAIAAQSVRTAGKVNPLYSPSRPRRSGQ